MQRATQPDAQYKHEASTDTWTYMHSVSSPTCKHTGKNSPKMHTKKLQFGKNNPIIITIYGYFVSKQCNLSISITNFSFHFIH